jgi:hypothetical protein
MAESNILTNKHTHQQTHRQFYCTSQETTILREDITINQISPVLELPQILMILTL